MTVGKANLPAMWFCPDLWEPVMKGWNPAHQDSTVHTMLVADQGDEGIKHTTG
jgi:hypothetical protein